MAKMFDVKTTSGSPVNAKMAGTESTAKMMSVASRKSSATKSGVAWSTPFHRTKKRWPCSTGVVGTKRRNSRTRRFFSGSTPFSGVNIILKPVMMRNAPKRTTTQWYCISALPSAMKAARKASAPMMP
jgi:hypothetical protein